MTSRGRSNKLTGQIGEFLVCAELGRQGLIATPFAGNVPAFDVLAADEEGRSVPLQVKTSRSEQWPSDASLWLDLKVVEGRQIKLGERKITHPNLIYVFVSLRTVEDTAGRDRFFVLTKRDLQQVLVAGYVEYMNANARNWRRPRNPKSFDCRLLVSQILHYENNWKLVSEQMDAQTPYADAAPLS